MDIEKVRHSLQRTHRQLVGVVGSLTVQGGQSANVRAITKLAKLAETTASALA